MYRHSTSSDIGLYVYHEPRDGRGLSSRRTVNKEKNILMTTILVTGATGNVGSQVIAQLSRKPAVTIRAAVHTLARAEKVKTEGAIPVVLDWDSPETFGPAVSGVDKIFLLSPPTPQLATQLRGLLDAARVAGVRHVVRMSALGADPKSPILLGRWHAEGDEAVRAVGIPYTIIQPGNFAQNFIHVYPPDAQGSIYLPWGEGKVAFIDTADIAEVIVTALTEPGHEGKVYEVTGSEAISAAQAAQVITDASGRKVRYVDIPEATAHDAMKALGMSDLLVKALLELHGVCKAGYANAVTQTVRQITGHTAKSFADFARENAASWRVA